MKKLLFFMLSSVCTLFYGCNHLRAEETRAVNRGEKRLEISFRFHQGGIASSQNAEIKTATKSLPKKMNIFITLSF